MVDDYFLPIMQKLARCMKDVLKDLQLGWIRPGFFLALIVARFEQGNGYMIHLSIVHYC